MPRPRIGFELEHAHEHRRHQLAVGDAIFFDHRQIGFRVEAFHHHHGAAKAMHCHAVAQRGSVIERRRRQIHHVRRELIKHGDEIGQRVTAIERPFGQRPAHALGPAGGAAGIEHITPAAFIGNARCRLSRQRRIEIGKAGNGATDGVARRNVGRRSRRNRAERGRRHQQLGARILYDVTGFIGGELGRHRDIDEAGALRAPADRQIIEAVGHQQCDRVAALEAM